MGDPTLVTCADVDDLAEDVGFKPDTSIENWHKKFHGLVPGVLQRLILLAQRGLT